MNQNISASELFQRVRELLILPDLKPETRNKMMHDTLILCCHEGVKDTKQAFGNLFSQVDYLCKVRGIKIADKIAIQTMRTPLDDAIEIDNESDDGYRAQQTEPELADKRHAFSQAHRLGCQYTTAT